LQLANSQQDSVIGRLPEVTRRAIDQNHRVQIRAPNHILVSSIQRLTSGPLLLVPACRPGDEAAVSGLEALSSIGPDVDVVLDDGPSRYRQASTIVACEQGRLEMVRAGVISERNVRRLASLMIAVVCTGNTCRSPMAEMLLKKQISTRMGVEPGALEDHGVLVVSAGVAAHPGSHASDQAVDVMREHGLDLSAHESRLLDERTARYADLLLTMTRGHRHAILQRWPELEPRTFTLCHDGSDVADPVGCPVEMYRRCADQIEKQLAAWVDQLAPQLGS
jgi:protein-tyrosine-phosphatase